MKAYSALLALLVNIGKIVAYLSAKKLRGTKDDKKIIKMVGMAVTSANLLVICYIQTG
jgi:hypothetical protein